MFGGKVLPSLMTLVVVVVSAHSCHALEEEAEPEPQVTALLIIDVQNCFLPPSGEVAVSNGNEVIPVINRIRQDYSSRYRSIVVTQDWHCPDHVSFASTHPGYEVNSHINLTYVTATGELCTETQVGGVKSNSQYAVSCTFDDSAQWKTISQKLWPNHCVRDTQGARFHPELVTAKADLVIRKGDHCQVDSYSAFNDNGELKSTGLIDKLNELEVTAVHIVGLATDYCVYYTARDAYGLGFETTVILDATRGVAQDTTQRALEDLRKLGVKTIQSTELKAIFKSSASAMTSYMRLVVLPTVVMAMLNLCR